jgi:hypothetical protein
MNNIVFMLLKEWWKGREDGEEVVRSYRINLRKSDGTGLWKRKHQIALSGEVALEETMEQSQCRLRSEGTILLFRVPGEWLTLNPLMWKIWWAPNNASRRQMGFNPAFKGLKNSLLGCLVTSLQLNVSERLPIKILYAFSSGFSSHLGLNNKQYLTICLLQMNCINYQAPVP